MADLTLNRYIASGSTAARLAFTPSPATPGSGPAFGEVWWDTDLQALFAWNVGTAAWVAVAGSGTVAASAIAQILRRQDDNTRVVMINQGTSTAAKTRAITLAIDGGGSTITTGVKADVYVPYACTITANTLIADQSGSAVVDIWVTNAFSSVPTVANTITASALPTLSIAAQSQDTTLTGWTTAISAGSRIRYNVNSATTVTRLNLTLTVTI